MKQPVIIKEIYEIGQEIDKAFYDGVCIDVISIENKVKNLPPQRDDFSNASLHYYLGTMYQDLMKQDGKDTDENIKHALREFREALSFLNNIRHKEESVSSNQDVLALHRQLCVNYGCLLCRCKRIIPVMEYYNSALLIDPNFSKAIGNLGRAYWWYGRNLVNTQDADIVMYFAYIALKTAIQNTEDLTEEERVGYAEYKDNIEENIPNLQSIKDIKSQPQTYEEDEKRYREWAAENNLFLNPLNDLTRCYHNIASDSQQLPGITIPIDKKPVFHGIFNQIKEEYSYARYLYYESINTEEQIHYADKDTVLLNSEPGIRYSIRLENLKTAYHRLYSLLDRVAYFLYLYYGLENNGLNSKNVSFNRVCKELIKQKYDASNIWISSIHWISNDFHDKETFSANPDAKEMKELRNYMEHRYVTVIEDYLYSDMEKKNFYADDENEIFYITEKRLRKLTFALMKIVREVIMYLPLVVRVEEEQKNQIRKEPAMPFYLDLYEDKWKR